MSASPHIFTQSDPQTSNEPETYFSLLSGDLSVRRVRKRKAERDREREREKFSGTQRFEM